jgi:hypothetical protein
VSSKRKLWLIGVAGLTAVGAALLAHFVGRQYFAEHLRTLAAAALDGKWSPPLFPSLLFVGIAVLLVLWKVPALQVSRSKALTDENKFDRENEARKTLAQILAGVFVLAGLYSSVQTFNLSREGQITDRFTKAIEQLGALDGTGQPKLEVRLGGIYALERIARDSERDHSVIMEVLTAYIREHSPYKGGDPKALKFDPILRIFLRQKTNPAPKIPVNAQDDKPRIGNHDCNDYVPDSCSLGADIQAILDVLGRRERKYDKGSLFLDRTDLRGADLSRADLGAVVFIYANLSGVYLSGANLTGAHLFEAYLINADLSGANLSSADLSYADLRGADLRNSNLKDAGLRGADLSGANLSGADFITQWMIESARGDVNTKLSPSLKKPDGWLK